MSTDYSNVVWHRVVDTDRITAIKQRVKKDNTIDTTTKDAFNNARRIFEYSLTAAAEVMRREFVASLEKIAPHSDLETFDEVAHVARDYGEFDINSAQIAGIIDGTSLDNGTKVRRHSLHYTNQDVGQLEQADHAFMAVPGKIFDCIPK